MKTFYNNKKYCSPPSRKAHYGGKFWAASYYLQGLYAKMKKVILKSNCNEAEVIFSNPTYKESGWINSYGIFIKDISINASLQIFDITGEIIDFVKIIKNIIENYPTQVFEEKWESFESDLCILINSDTTGHLKLRIKLINESPLIWELDYFITIDFVQLDVFYNELKSFFSLNPHRDKEQ